MGNLCWTRPPGRRVVQQSKDVKFNIRVIGCYGVNLIKLIRYMHCWRAVSAHCSVCQTHQESDSLDIRIDPTDFENSSLNLL
jgi:hypothetical protein